VNLHASFPLMLIYYRHKSIVTNSMQQDPSCKTDSLSAGQDILCVVWNPKFHCRAYKSPPLGPILNQMIPAHSLFTICLNIILSSTSRSRRWSLSFRFFRLKFYMHFSTLAPCYMPHPSYAPLFVHSN
jgi:hypothetical protein